MPEIKHGTQTGYAYYGCRCDECRKANTDAQKKWREKKKSEQVFDFEHGTFTGYFKGCRCEHCTLVHEYKKNKY